jgi:hypothetical protein
MMTTKKPPCVTRYLDVREFWIIAKQKRNNCAETLAEALKVDVNDGAAFELAILRERTKAKSPHLALITKFGELVSALHDATELHDIARDLQQRKMQQLEDFDFSPLQVSKK